MAHARTNDSRIRICRSSTVANARSARSRFEINDGETVGFLGLNGAGKTTALRILACDLRPSAGTIEVGGVDAVAEPHEVRKRIGFLPENPPLYVGHDRHRLPGVRGRAARHDRRRRSSGGCPTSSRSPTSVRSRSDPIGTLSHGFRQRVGVAQAIIHQPKFLILDEPTRGLDPVQIVEMRNLIHDLKQNHTVLISSHILTEISQTCDRLLVLGTRQAARRRQRARARGDARARSARSR